MTTSPAEEIIKVAQKKIEAVPVIVLGSGASTDYGVPGMDALREHLLNIIKVDGLISEDIAAWQRFSETIRTTDLESALQTVQMSARINEQIINATWALISEHDREIFKRALAGKIDFPLTKLLQRLFQSTHTVVEIITTNYDLIAESAVETGEFYHYTGFSFGRLRHWQVQPLSVQQNGRQVRTVNIWKVHGSLDWFMTSNSQVVGVPFLPALPTGLTPLIVTPGLEKFRRTHLDPFRSILAEADRALVNARAYLCVGYGFNDEHIQPKLVSRCERDNVPILVLAKQLTEAAKRFLLGGRCKQFLAFEESAGGTRAFSSAAPNGVDLRGLSLWKFDKLLDAAL